MWAAQSLLHEVASKATDRHVSARRITDNPSRSPEASHCIMHSRAVSLRWSALLGMPPVLQCSSALLCAGGLLLWVLLTARSTKVHCCIALCSTVEEISASIGHPHHHHHIHTAVTCCSCMCECTLACPPVSPNLCWHCRRCHCCLAFQHTLVQARSIQHAAYRCTGWVCSYMCVYVCVLASSCVGTWLSLPYLVV